ncbi:MAG: ABC transporter permease [Blastocatellia bacterium AA13]|nr:MAG: ABC transporter permease [Blastocatellia bacterium AA13]
MNGTMMALLHRDMRVARRELKYFIMRVGLQPLLFTFIFGYVMPRQGIVARGYGNLLLPGILALSMTLSGMQAVALPLVVEFGWTKEIEDRLLAPISIKGVALEKILVGIIQAVIAGLFVLPLAWLMMRSGLDLQAGNVALLISVALLTSWLFAALGMVVGTLVAPQQIGLIFNVLIGPMIFFGCAYYPWEALKVIPWFQKFVLINPLVYASEGFRAALTPQSPHMPLWLILGGLIGFCGLFTYVGLSKFERRALE